MNPIKRTLRRLFGPTEEEIAALVETAQTEKIADLILEKSSRAEEIMIEAATRSMFGGGDQISPKEFRRKQNPTYYQDAVWVYSSLFQIFTAALKIPWHLYERRPDGSKGERIDSHWIADLVQKPNPKSSWGDIVENTLGHLELTGDGFLELAREGSFIPNELYVLPSQNVEKKGTPRSGVTGYRYTEGGRYTDFEPEEIVHVRYFNPLDPFYGQGSITAARDSIETDIEARALAKRTSKHGAVPPGFFKQTKEMMGGAKGAERFREAFRQKMDEYNRTGRFPVLRDLEWVSMGATEKETQSTEQRRLSREEIVAAMGVTQMRAGILDKATYANFEKSDVVFWEGMVTRLDKFCAAFNVQFVWEFDERVVLAPDYSDISALQEDKNQLAQRHAIYVQNKIMSVDEVREELGLEPAEWAGEENPFGSGPNPFEQFAAGGDTDDDDEEGEGPPSSERTASFAGGFRKAQMAEDLDGLFPDDRSAAIALYALIEDPIRESAIAGARDQDAAAHGKGVCRLLTKDHFALDRPLWDKNPLRKQYDLAGDPDAAEYLRKYGLEKSSVISSALKARLRKLLAKWASDPTLTEQDLADRLVRYVEDQKENEGWARTVARTEVAQAVNFGGQQAIRAAGAMKQWLSALLDTSRPVHIETHTNSANNPVMATEDFQPIGAPYPGHPKLAVRDIVNCLCLVVAFVPGLSDSGKAFYALVSKELQGERIEELHGRFIPGLQKFLDGYVAVVIERLRSGKAA